MDYFTLTIIGLLIFPSALSTRNGKLLQSPSKETLERTCPCLPVAVCQQHQGTNSNAEFLGLIPVCEELSFVRCCGAPPLKKVSFPAELIRNSRLDYTPDTSAETSLQEKESYKEALLRKLYDTRGLKKEVLHKVKGKARSERDTEQVLAHEAKDETGVTMETATHPSYDRAEGETLKYEMTTDSERMFVGEVTDPMLTVGSTDAPGTEVPETEKPGLESATEINSALHSDISDPNSKESVTSPKTETLEKTDVLPTEAEAAMRSDLSAFSTTLSSASPEVDADIIGGTEKTEVAADKKIETPEISVGQKIDEHTTENISSITPQATSFHSTEETEITTEPKPTVTEKSVQVTTQKKTVRINKTSFPIDFRKVKKSKYLDVKEQIESQVAVVFAASRDEDQNSTVDDKDVSKESDDLVKENSEIKVNLYNKIGSQLTGDRHHIQRIPLRKRVKIYRKFKPSEEQALKELIYDSFRNKSSIFPNNFLRNVNNTTNYQKTEQISGEESETNKISDAKLSFQKDGSENLEGSHSSRVQVFVLKPNSSESAHTLTLESEPSRFEILRRDPEKTLNRPLLRTPPAREPASTIKPRTTVSTEPSRPPSVNRGKIKYKGSVIKDDVQVSHTTKPSRRIKPSAEKERSDSSTVAPSTVAVAHSTENNMKYPELKPTMPVTDSVRVDQINSTHQEPKNQPILVNSNDQAAKQEVGGLKQEFLTGTQNSKMEGEVVSVSQTEIEKKHDQDGSRNESLAQIQSGEKEEKVVLQSNSGVEESHHQGESHHAPLSHTQNGENRQQVLLQSHGGMTASNHQGGLKYEPLSHIHSGDKGQQVVLQNQAGVEGIRGQGGLKHEPSSHTQSEEQQVVPQSHAGVEGGHHQEGLKQEPLYHAQNVDKGEKVLLQSHAGAKGSHQQEGSKHEPLYQVQSGEKGQQVVLQSHAAVEAGHPQGGLKHEFSAASQSSGQRGTDLPSSNSEVEKRYQGGLRPGISSLTQNRRNQKIGSPSHVRVHKQNHGRLQQESSSTSQGSEGVEVASDSHAGVRKRIQGGLRREFPTRHQNTGVPYEGTIPSRVRIDRRNQSPSIQTNGAKTSPAKTSAKDDDSEDALDKNPSAEKDEQEISFAETNSHSLAVPLREETSLNNNLFKPPAQFESGFVPLRNFESLNVESSTPARPGSSQNYQSHSSAVLTNPLQNPQNSAYTTINKYFGHSSNPKPSLTLNANSLNELHKEFTPQNVKASDTNAEPAGKPSIPQSNPSHKAQVRVTPNMIKEHHQVISQNLQLTNPQLGNIRRPSVQQLNSGTRFEIQRQPNQQYYQNPPNNFNTIHEQTTSKPTEAPSTNLLKKMPEFIMKQFLSIFNAQQQDQIDKKKKVGVQTSEPVQKQPPRFTDSVQQKPTASAKGEVGVRRERIRQKVRGRRPQVQKIQENAALVNFYEENGRQPVTTTKVGLTAFEILKTHFQEKPQAETTAQTQPEPQQQPEALPQPQQPPQSQPQFQRQLQSQPQPQPRPQQTESESLTALDILQSHFQPHESPSRSHPQQPHIQLQSQPETEAQIEAKPQPQQTESPRVTASDNLQSHLISQPEPQSLPESRPRIRPRPRPRSRSRPRPQLQPQFPLETQVKVEPQSQVQAQPQQSESSTVTALDILQSNFKSQPLSEPQSRPRFQPRPRPQLQPQSHPELQAQAQAEPQPQPQSQAVAQPQQSESTRLTAHDILQSHFQSQPSFEPQSRPVLQPRPKMQSQPQTQAKFQPQPQPEENLRLQKGSQTNDIAKTDINEIEQVKVLGPMNTIEQSVSVESQPGRKHGKRPFSRRRLKGNRVSSKKLLSTTDNASLEVNRAMLEGAQLKKNSRYSETSQERYLNKFKQRHGGSAPSEAILMQRNGVNGEDQMTTENYPVPFPKRIEVPNNSPITAGETSPVRNSSAPRRSEVPNNAPVPSIEASPRRRSQKPKRFEVPNSAPASEVATSPIRNSPVPKRFEVPSSSVVAMQETSPTRSSPVPKRFEVPNSAPVSGVGISPVRRSPVPKRFEIPSRDPDREAAFRAAQMNSSPVPRRIEVPNSAPQSVVRTSPVRRSPDPKRFEIQSRDPESAARTPPISSSPVPKRFEVPNSAPVATAEASPIGSSPIPKRIEVPNSAPVTGGDTSPIRSNPVPKRFEVPNSAPVTTVEASPIGSSPVPKRFEVPNSAPVTSGDTSSIRSSPVPKRFEVPNSVPATGVETLPISSSPASKRFKVPNSAPVTRVEASPISSSSVPKRSEPPNSAQVSGIKASANPGQASIQNSDQAPLDVQTRLLVPPPMSGDIVSINQNSHAPLHSILNSGPTRETTDSERHSLRQGTKQRGRNRHRQRVTSQVQDSTSSESATSTTESSVPDVEQALRFPSRRIRPKVTQSPGRRENLPSRRRQNVKSDPQKASESTSEATPQVGDLRRQNFASAKPSADADNMNEMFIQAMRSMQQLLQAR